MSKIWIVSFSVSRFPVSVVSLCGILVSVYSMVSFYSAGGRRLLLDITEYSSMVKAD